MFFIASSPFPCTPLGFSSGLGAFRATPGTPHLGLLPLGRALKALHPSQGIPSRCLLVSNLINLYETRNSCERHLYWDVLRIWSGVKEGILQAYRRYGGNIASIGVDTWG